MWYNHTMTYYLAIKRMKYLYILQHDEPQKPPYLVKEASHKRAYNIRFHICEMSIRHKSVDTEVDQWLQSAEMENEE